MGKRQPAGAPAGGKPPGASKFGGGAGSAPAGAKKNPFDFFRHKAKHEVANARSRNVNVAKSRSQAIEKRMGTIGMELAQRHKTGELIDRRFGEKDSTISKEDKMLIRFQRTRQKQLVNEKRQMFNLNSDDEEDDGEEFVLTHRGRTVDEMYGPSVPKVVLSEEEDDSASVDSFEEAKRDGAQKVDFGGMTLKSRPSTELDGDGDPTTDILKTKSEVMSELITKSKAYRYEKQKGLSERKDQVDTLDEGFDELRELLGVDKQQVRALKKQQRSMTAIEGDDDGSEIDDDEQDSFDDVGSESESDDSASDEESEKNENAMDVDDDFDKMVKKLSQPGIRRAKPSNALLTEASIARAEQERLMQLEKQRIARMNAVVEDKEDEAPVPIKRREADDLDDDFSRQWLPQDSDSDEDSEEDEEGEEDEEDEEGDISDASDDESDDISDDEQEDYEGKAKKKAKLEESDQEDQTNDLNEILTIGPEDELPYTLAMPSTYEAFSSLLSNQSPQRQAILISRLRACHHISLSPSNRPKLEKLLTFLFKRASEVGNIWKTELEAFNKEKTEKSSNKANGAKSNETSNVKLSPTVTTSRLLNLLEILVKPIFEMTNQLPEFAPKAAKDVLLMLEQAHLQDLASAAESSGHSVVPSFSTLTFAHLMTILFSASDRRHALMSPLLLHVLHVLGTCRMQTTADVQRSVFLASVLLNFLGPAKRFSGEPLSLLFFIIHAFLTQNELLPKASVFDQFNPILYIQPNSLKVTDKTHCKEAKISGKSTLMMLVPSPALAPSNGEMKASNNGSDSATPNKKKKNDKEATPSKSEASATHSRDIVNKDVAIIQAVHTALLVLHNHLQIFTGEVAAAELFLQTHRLLTALHDSYLPEATSKLRSKMIAMCDRTKKTISQLRMPLQQFAKVVETLPALTPDFDDSYFGEKMTVDKVAKETQRMKRKIKSEQKGAEKELRKDTKFIQQLKMKQRGEKIAERKKTNNTNLAMLEQQQSEMNKKEGKRKRGH